MGCETQNNSSSVHQKTREGSFLFVCLFLNHSSCRQELLRTSGLDSHPGAGLTLLRQGEHGGPADRQSPSPQRAQQYWQGSGSACSSPQVDTTLDVTSLSPRHPLLQLPKAALGTTFPFHQTCEEDKHWPRGSQYSKLGKKLNLFNLPLSFSKRGYIQGQRACRWQASL